MKNFILKKLHILLEEGGYRIAPQDYGAEFKQTGSGKSMVGISNKLVISDEALNKVMAELALAKQLSITYKKLWDGGNDEKDMGTFIEWKGKRMLMKVPKQLKIAIGPNGRPVDYSNYFNDPTMGDGGFQYKLYRNGYIEGGLVKGRADMGYNPNLGGATDAGYNKAFDDRIKYFFVKAGIEGKYQEEAGRFASILDTPAIDAAIKVRVIYHDEILDFLTKDKGKTQYTSDEKGRGISNKMEFTKKIEKVRKDAEIIIGKPVSSSNAWTGFLKGLKELSPEEQESMDIETMTNEFVKIYQEQNTVLHKGKQQIIMPPDEEAEWQKQQKEKLARIVAAKARMRK